MRWLIIGSSIVILLMLSVMALLDIDSPLRAFSTVYKGYFASKSAYTHEVSFVGDVFLGRDVETKMRLWGYDYPFAGDRSDKDELRVANFESAAPNSHVHTPNYTFRFSVDQAFLPVLYSAGFSYVSLANNHSLDYGTAAARETVAALEESGIEPFGAVATSSVVFETSSGTLLAVSGFNDVTDTVTKTMIEEMFSEVASSSEHQIAYIHWGAEYETVHNARQEALARLLIDAGYDAVIGHHPHVVQDVGWYQGAPVFYSLGNYIFDQYFDDEVQVGMRLALSFSPKEVTYHLIPVSSKGTYIQPVPLADDGKQSLLFRMAADSHRDIAEAVAAGRIKQQI